MVVRQVLAAVIVLLLSVSTGLPGRAQEAAPPRPAVTREPPSVAAPLAPAAQAPAAPAPVAAPIGVTTGKALPVGLRELSPWSMFLTAGLVVQAIMTGLAFASLVTWTILLAKLGQLALARRRVTAALRRIGKNARSLAEAQAGLGARGFRGRRFRGRLPWSELRLSEGRFVDETASRSASPRVLRDRRERGAARGAAWACSRPSARPRRSSACSARCGAS